LPGKWFYHSGLSGEKYSFRKLKNMKIQYCKRSLSLSGDRLLVVEKKGFIGFCTGLILTGKERNFR